MKPVPVEEEKQSGTPLTRDVKRIIRGGQRATLGIAVDPAMRAASSINEYLTGKAPPSQLNDPNYLKAVYGEWFEPLEIGGKRGLGPKPALADVDVSGPAAQVAAEIRAKKEGGGGGTQPPAQPTAPAETPAPTAAPTENPAIPQSKEGELPWQQMTHGGNQMAYRVTEKNQMTPEQTAQANFRDKSKGTSDALLEARGIGGGGDDTSIEGIAKMILYDNTLLPSEKAGALAKLRSIEAGPNSVVEAAKIQGQMQLDNTQKLIDAKVAEGKLSRDFNDPYNQVVLYQTLGEKIDEYGNKTFDPALGRERFLTIGKAQGFLPLDTYEIALLKDRNNKETRQKYNKKFGEGAAEKIIGMYLSRYLKDEEKEK